MRKTEMTRKTGRGQHGEKETEEEQEWAKETRNEVKIDSAGETSGSALCWFKQRTGCLVLYNHGEQSVITPPPVPISSRVLLDSPSPLLFLTSSSLNSSPSSYCFLFLFRSFHTLVYPSCVLYLVASSIPLFCASLFVVRARRTDTTFLLFSSVHPESPDAAVTRITRIASKTANNKCFSALRNAVKFLPTQHRFYRARAIFPENRKPRIRETAWSLLIVEIPRVESSMR